MDSTFTSISGIEELWGTSSADNFLIGHRVFSAVTVFDGGPNSASIVHNLYLAGDDSLFRF